MVGSKENLKRICSFYVSDWHLISMLLPYISNNIDEKTNITNITEKNIKENVVEFISKLNLSEQTEKRILEINWNKEKVYQYKKTHRDITTEIIIISGNKSFIDKINKNIQKYLRKIIKDRNVIILNCYEVLEFNQNIDEILNLHDKVLNTSGEKEIDEVFDGYQCKRDIAINE